MANSYSYTNEDDIDDELKCTVCLQPFSEPVTSQQCHHTFCKECINTCMNRERLCPLCRTDSDYGCYQPVRSRILINQLDRLLVRCDACQERNIQRGNFPNHSQNCPNWIIPCTSSDIRCAWRGMRSQLNTHLASCLFQHIRPIAVNLQERIERQDRQINGLQNRQYLLVFGLLVVIFVSIWLILQLIKTPDTFFEKLYRMIFG